jgi:hypothetical protein
MVGQLKRGQRKSRFLLLVPRKTRHSFSGKLMEDLDLLFESTCVGAHTQGVVHIFVIDWISESSSRPSREQE